MICTLSELWFVRYYDLYVIATELQMASDTFQDKKQL